MEVKIEIKGKEYYLSLTRRDFALLEIDGLPLSKAEEMPLSFNDALLERALLSGNEDLSKEEAELLVEEIYEEYDMTSVTKVLTKMTNSVFSSEGSTKKVLTIN